MNNLNSVILEGIIIKNGVNNYCRSTRHVEVDGATKIKEIDVPFTVSGKLKTVFDERGTEYSSVRIVGRLDRLHLTLGIRAEHMEFKPKLTGVDP